MGTEDDGRSKSPILRLNPLTPTGISKFLFLPLAKYIINADIGTPFYELDANEMLLYAHIYNLADQTRRKQGESFSDKNGKVYILPENYELCCFMRSSDSTIKRTLKKLQTHEMIRMEQSRRTRQRILYVKESFPETETGERIIPASPAEMPFMTGRINAMRGFYRIPLTICGRRGERRNVYSENLSPETILIYSVLLDTALSAANTDAYIESNEEPYIYVRYGYESLAKRLHIAKLAGDGEKGIVTSPHATMRRYIQALESSEIWNGLIHHIRAKNDRPGQGNLKGVSYYSVHDYSVSGTEEGFYLEGYDAYLQRMEKEACDNAMSFEDLLSYGQYGYKKETAPDSTKDETVENIIIADGNDPACEAANAPAEAEEVKTEPRRGQNETTKGSKQNYETTGQNETTKRSKQNHEEVKTEPRRSQNETTKRSKQNCIKKDSIKKETTEKETPVYISSSQETPNATVRLNPWEAEVLPPAGEEEEENTDRLHPSFNPHAPGARQALEDYHRRKRMRCSFDEFWRFNENKGWKANGKRVQDPVALLAGFESRYVKEHPESSILFENGTDAAGDADLNAKKARLLRSLMSNRLYGRNAASGAYSMEYST